MKAMVVDEWATATSTKGKTPPPRSSKSGEKVSRKPSSSTPTVHVHDEPRHGSDRRKPKRVFSDASSEGGDQPVTRSAPKIAKKKSSESTPSPVTEHHRSPAHPTAHPPAPPAVPPVWPVHQPPPAAMDGQSTAESVDRARLKHRRLKKVPTQLTEDDYDAIMAELTRRRNEAKAKGPEADPKEKVSAFLKMTDADLYEVLMALKADRGGGGPQRDGKPRRRVLGDEKAPEKEKKTAALGGVGPDIGIPSLPQPQFLPAVWALQAPRTLPPGAYIDGKPPPSTVPVDVTKGLLAAGPFGVGEAKACLDDLQATLLSYYGKLYAVEPGLPLEWQIEQLRRNYYPSPYPISGESPKVLEPGQDLSKLAGALPPPFPNALTVSAGSSVTKRDPGRSNDTRKALDQGVGKPAPNAQPAPSLKPGPGPAVPKSDPNALPTPDPQASKAEQARRVDRGILGVVTELQELGSQNMERVDKLLKEAEYEIGDPTSRNFFRGDKLQRTVFRAPSYGSGSHLGHLNELEQHVETMYRNLRTTAEWNRRKIRLLEDRLRIMHMEEDRRDMRNGF